MTAKTDPKTETAAGAEPAAESCEPFSVFEGLALAGVTDRMIAEFCYITVDQAAAWRKGREVAPMGRVVFMTMLLSHVVDELVKTYDEWGPAPKAWHLHMKACLEKANAALKRQETENMDAPDGAFRQAERLFEEWLESNAARGWASEAANRVALGRDPTGLGI